MHDLHGFKLLLSESGRENRREVALGASCIQFCEFALLILHVKETLEIEQLQVELLRGVLDPHLGPASDDGALHPNFSLVALQEHLARDVAGAVAARVVGAREPTIVVAGKALAGESAELKAQGMGVELDI